MKRRLRPERGSQSQSTSTRTRRNAARSVPNIAIYEDTPWFLQGSRRPCRLSDAAPCPRVKDMHADRQRAWAKARDRPSSDTIDVSAFAHPTLANVIHFTSGDCGEGPGTLSVP